MKPAVRITSHSLTLSLSLSFTCALVFATRDAHAIVDGTPDTTRPDVLVLLDESAPGFRCTATLIAPNLVVTARHCVGKNSGTSQLCNVGASDEGAQSLPVYDGDVPAAPMFVAATPSTAALAHGLTVIDDGAPTTCGHDVALIQLDKPVSGIVPAKVRRTPVATNDALTVMGFGWVDRAATINATQRMRGTTKVLALGAVVYAFKPFGAAAQPSQSVAVADGEIAVAGLTMTGDSGGPAFDASGELAAVVARGYGDPSYGPGTFTTLAAHLPTIDAALVKSGNAPADAGVDASPEDAGTTPDAGTAAPDASAPDAGGRDIVESASPESSGCGIARTSSSSGATVVALLLAVALVSGSSYRRSSGRRRADR